MTYEEVKEAKRRLELLETSGLSFDVRLDNKSMDDYPEFYYFHVQIEAGEIPNEVVVVELLINEDPAEEEIQLTKCDYQFISEELQQQQQEIYDVCKLIVSHYLNGKLVKAR